MPDKYLFSDVARSERFYVATILGHILMADGFRGLRLLFKKVFGEAKVKPCLRIKDFEIVSELDPLRDASVYNEEVRKLYRKYRRIAVPDLFLRWGGLCLVLEAKFFTDPSAEELGAQIALQKQAIARIKGFTRYADVKFASLALDRMDKIKNVTALTWDDILGIAEEISPAGASDDLLYCRKILAESVARARKELETFSAGIMYAKYKFGPLMAMLRKERKGFVGFQGGARALALLDRKALERRSHYKFSVRSWSRDNWIDAEEFLSIVEKKLE